MISHYPEEHLCCDVRYFFDASVQTTAGVIIAGLCDENHGVQWAAKLASNLNQRSMFVIRKRVVAHAGPANISTGRQDVGKYGIITHVTGTPGLREPQLSEENVRVPNPHSPTQVLPCSFSWVCLVLPAMVGLWANPAIQSRLAQEAGLLRDAPLNLDRQLGCVVAVHPVAYALPTLPPSFYPAPCSPS
jgi:hypothetical protein